MFSLPPLPYAYDALMPVLSDLAMTIHHDRHHRAYVNALNGLIGGVAGEFGLPLEDMILQGAGEKDGKLFNNAAQAWNHSFFWLSMTPEPTPPTAALAASIERSFLSLAGLRAEFVGVGASHFGSGWVWLAAESDGRISVRATHDAGNLLDRPLTTPLLVCDLWEHAYYLDRQNDRRGFLEAWFDSLPNWTFAASQLAAARGQGEIWRHPAPTRV